MTEQERNELAEIIAEKVFELIKERQQELDEQFLQQAKAHDIQVHLNEVVGKMKIENNSEEQYLAELSRLMTLQSSYLEKENYEKAAKIRDKIIRIEQILKNL
jgi:excinuclease UvrABC helicase subunit UvrB